MALHRRYAGSLPGSRRSWSIAASWSTGSGQLRKSCHRSDRQLHLSEHSGSTLKLRALQSAIVCPSEFWKWQ
jgi:hypothetical protein